MIDLYIFPYNSYMCGNGSIRSRNHKNLKSYPVSISQFVDVKNKNLLIGKNKECPATM